MSESEEPRNRPENREGPSWALMLALILLAILAAAGIAWAFIHPMLHPR